MTGNDDTQGGQHHQPRRTLRTAPVLPPRVLRAFRNKLLVDFLTGLPVIVGGVWLMYRYLFVP